MSVTFKQLTDYLIETGADAVSHTKKGYLAHAIGVYNDLKKWGFDEDFSRAGLFHSLSYWLSRLENMPETELAAS